LERLVLLLGQSSAAKAAPAPDLYVVNRGDAAQAVALELARGLRLKGLAVELDCSGAAFGKQFKRADRSGAAWALVLGDAEVESAQLRLQPLRSEAATEAMDLVLPLRDLDAVLAALAP
jgi:histidyl-tRNA synthetase